MKSIIQTVTFITENSSQLIAGLNGVVAFLTGLFMFIPGPQPEATLRAIAAWLEQYSRK